jgi:hypothetical protein
MIIADTYTVSSSTVIFSFSNSPVAKISLSTNGLHVNIQGTDDQLPIIKGGIDHRLNWLLMGFDKDERLLRLVIDFQSINLSNLYQDLSSIFEKFGISLIQLPPLNNQKKP